MPSPIHRHGRSVMPWPPLLTKLIETYERVQVELHGKYSVERVADLHAYERSYAPWQCVLVLVATPLPCLLIIVAMDLVPLNAPDAGYDHNTVLWVRVFFVAFAIGAALLEQGRCLVAGIPLSTRALWAYSLVMALGSTVYPYLLASRIGFPLPFTIILTAPCFCSTFGIIGYVLWGPLLRESRLMRREALAYIQIMVVQFSLTVVYPAYNYLFIQLSGFEQTVLALLLPIVKLVAKNAISWIFSPRLEDLKPEIVIFNVEVFHALFVSCCMQNSRSWSTTIALMGVDLVHALSSLHDVDVRLRTIETLEAKLRAAEAKSELAVAASHSSQSSLQLIEKAMYFVHLDKDVQSDANIRLQSVEAMAMPTSVAIHPVDADAPIPVDAWTSPRAADVDDEPTVEKPVPDHADGDSAEPALPRTFTKRKAVFYQNTASKYVDIAGLVSNLPEDKRSSLGVLTTKERVAYVTSILQVLHLTEFVLLVEFVEVVIPVVYCVYLTAMFYLPNRAYYPQLAQLTSHSLLATISSTLTYAALEFVSFVLMCVALRRKLQISSVHQLAFVVHRQWNLVQSKMVLWVVFSVQISLAHFGYDYSFRFAWLRNP